MTTATRPEPSMPAVTSSAVDDGEKPEGLLRLSRPHMVALRGGACARAGVGMGAVR